MIILLRLMSIIWFSIGGYEYLTGQIETMFEYLVIGILFMILAKLEEKL